MNATDGLARFIVLHLRACAECAACAACAECAECRHRTRRRRPVRKAPVLGAPGGTVAGVERTGVRGRLQGGPPPLDARRVGLVGRVAR